MNLVLVYDRSQVCQYCDVADNTDDEPQTHGTPLNYQEECCTHSYVYELYKHVLLDPESMRQSPLPSAGTLFFVIGCPTHGTLYPLPTSPSLPSTGFFTLTEEKPVRFCHKHRKRIGAGTLKTKSPVCMHQG